MVAVSIRGCFELSTSPNHPPHSRSWLTTGQTRTRRPCHPSSLFKRTLIVYLGRFHRRNQSVSVEEGQSCEIFDPIKKESTASSSSSPSHNGALTPDKREEFIEMVLAQGLKTISYPDLAAKVVISLISLQRPTLTSSSASR